MPTALSTLFILINYDVYKRVQIPPSSHKEQQQQKQQQQQRRQQ